MIRIAVAVILFMVSAAALATTLYRWVDDEGRVHFSDRPEPGAEEMEIRDVQTFEGDPAPPQRPARPDKPKPFKYASLAIEQPGAEETFWNTGGELKISLRVQPNLLPGHKLHVLLDGQAVGTKAGRSLTLDINDVYRGEHSLIAYVTDAAGKELIRAKPVTFYVQQSRVKRAP